jgi:hypothetical protein
MNHFALYHSSAEQDCRTDVVESDQRIPLNDIDDKNSSVCSEQPERLDFTTHEDMDGRPSRWIKVATDKRE